MILVYFIISVTNQVAGFVKNNSKWIGSKDKLDKKNKTDIARVWRMDVKNLDNI